MGGCISTTVPHEILKGDECCIVVRARRWYLSLMHKLTRTVTCYPLASDIWSSPQAPALIAVTAHLSSAEMLELSYRWPANRLNSVFDTEEPRVNVSRAVRAFLWERVPWCMTPAQSINSWSQLALPTVLFCHRPYNAKLWDLNCHSSSMRFMFSDRGKLYWVAVWSREDCCFSQHVFSSFIFYWRTSWSIFTQ